MRRGRDSIRAHTGVVAALMPGLRFRGMRVARDGLHQEGRCEKRRAQGAHVHTGPLYRHRHLRESAINRSACDAARGPSCLTAADPCRALACPQGRRSLSFRRCRCVAGLVLGDLVLQERVQRLQRLPVGGDDLNPSAGAGLDIGVVEFVFEPG